jgi:hypothetical protein
VKQQGKRLSALILKFCPAMETFSLIYTKSTRGIMNSEFLTKNHCCFQRSSYSSCIHVRNYNDSHSLIFFKLVAHKISQHGVCFKLVAKLQPTINKSY